MIPSEASSGDKRKQGGITRCEPKEIRGLLIQCAWQAIRKDMSLKDFYDSLANRSSKQTAIVTVAHKLLLRIRACFKHGTLYECKQ